MRLNKQVDVFLDDYASSLMWHGLASGHREEKRSPELGSRFNDFHVARFYSITVHGVFPIRRKHECHTLLCNHRVSLITSESVNVII